jgi:hypothetical protein
MHIIQNYTLKKNAVKKVFAAGDGVASRDQEAVQWPTPRLTDTGSRLSMTKIWFIAMFL